METVNGFIPFEAGNFNLFWPACLPVPALEEEFRQLFYDDRTLITRFESEETQIQPGEWVVDVYGGVPVFPAYALQRGANVLVVEPNRELCLGLCYSFRDEISQGKLKVLHGCLVGQADANGQHSIKPETLPARSQRSIPTSHGFGDIPTYSLDGLLGCGTLTHLHFLRIDPEEFSKSILSGGKRCLEICNPRISIRLHQASSDLPESLSVEFPAYSTSREIFDSYSILYMNPRKNDE